MWNRLKCYLSGHHEYGVWCEPGAIFLRCVHCGKRSGGWDLEHKPVAPRAAAITRTPVITTVRATALPPPRVLPFQRESAR